MRSTLALLSLAAMLAGCPRSSGNDGSPPQTLDACLMKWWRGYYGACEIMPECSGATGELQQACAAADCHWMAFSGYRNDGTNIEGNAIWSSSNSLLCAKDILSATWILADSGHIEVTYGVLPPQTLAATCSGTDANVGGRVLMSLPADVSAVLASRAASGSWAGCAY